MIREKIILPQSVTFFGSFVNLLIRITYNSGHGIVIMFNWPRKYGNIGPNKTFVYVTIRYQSPIY